MNIQLSLLTRSEATTSCTSISLPISTRCQGHGIAYQSANLFSSSSIKTIIPASG